MLVLHRQPVTYEHVDAVAGLDVTISGRHGLHRDRLGHFATVQQSFFAQLSDQEVATLADIFGRFAPSASEACTASPDSQADLESR